MNGTETVTDLLTPSPPWIPLDALIFESKQSHLTVDQGGWSNWNQKSTEVLESPLHDRYNCKGKTVVEGQNPDEVFQERYNAIQQPFAEGGHSTTTYIE
jgi:hypothetical protein